MTGTYTPIAQLGLGVDTGRTVLFRVWVGAAAGIVQSCFWGKAPKILHTSIYIGLGWIILPHAREVSFCHSVFLTTVRDDEIPSCASAHHPCVEQYQGTCLHNIHPLVKSSWLTDKIARQSFFFPGMLLALFTSLCIPLS